MSEKGIKRERGSRRQETPSQRREVEMPQVETSNTGKETLTNFNTVDQESLDENNLENQLNMPSQISNEIRAWSQMIEQKNNDRIERMRWTTILKLFLERSKLIKAHFF